MAENGTLSEGTLPLQEPVKPPEGERSVVKKALNETAKFLFPFAEMASKFPREDLEEVYRVGTAKKIRAGVTAFGGLIDIARYAGVVDSVINAVDADSTMSIVKFSALAAGYLSPNLVHLASKNRFLRETGRRVGRGAVNVVLGKASAFRDNSPKK